MKMMFSLRNVCAEFAQCLRNVCAMFAQCLRRDRFAQVCAVFAQCLRSVCAGLRRGHLVCGNGHLRKHCLRFAHVCACLRMFAHIVRKHENVCAVFTHVCACLRCLRTGQLADGLGSKISANKSSPFDGRLTRAAMSRVADASRSRRLRPGCWLMRRWGGGRAAHSAPPCPVAGPRAAYW
jgi:hypothetical protein